MSDLDLSDLNQLTVGSSALRGAEPRREAEFVALPRAALLLSAGAVVIAAADRGVGAVPSAVAALALLLLARRLSCGGASLTFLVALGPYVLARSVVISVSLPGIEVEVAPARLLLAALVLALLEHGRPERSIARVWSAGLTRALVAATASLFVLGLGLRLVFGLAIPTWSELAALSLGALEAAALVFISLPRERPTPS